MRGAARKLSLVNEIKLLGLYKSRQHTAAQCAVMFGVSRTYVYNLAADKKRVKRAESLRKVLPEFHFGKVKQVALPVIENGGGMAQCVRHSCTLRAQMCAERSMRGDRGDENYVGCRKCDAGAAMRKQLGVK